MNKMFRFITLFTSILFVAGCSPNRSENSFTLDKIQNVNWNKLTANMAAISGDSAKVIHDIQVSLQKVKSYRSQGKWKVQWLNPSGRDYIELWATFVMPDRIKLKYHNVFRNEWDEQIFIADRRFSHFNQITKKGTNKVERYKDVYVPIEDKVFKETIDKIAYDMSLQKYANLFQNPNVQEVRAWENGTRYIICFIVRDWEAFIRKRDYIFWMSVEKNTLHPQQIKIQSTPDGNGNIELLQAFYDYDKNMEIQEPRPDQFLNIAENKSHKVLKDFNDAGELLTYYYKDPDPDNLVQAIKIISSEDKVVGNLDRAWPAVHFFATALQADKTKIDSIKVLMEESRDKQKEFLLRVINETENFKSIVPNDPNDLDCLWTEFMATGKEEPVGKILKTLFYTTEDIDLSSLVWRTEGISSKQQALDILKHAAAWSLTANARQHKRVYEILNKEMRETEDAALKEEIGRILKLK